VHRLEALGLLRGEGDARRINKLALRHCLEELLGVIFDPYRRGAQGSTPTPRASRGLGLGLFIVRQIVLAHGGSIDVRSSVDEGTTFTVRLPRAHAER
jgi:signal transduction histidine kinase